MTLLLQNTDTTRYVFSDESYGYISNGTYFAADGTFSRTGTIPAPMAPRALLPLPLRRRRMQAPPRRRGVVVGK